MNIYEKLVEVRKVVPYLQKENKGNQYKYVSSSQVLSNCKAKMDELGLILLPSVVDHKVTESPIEQFDKEGHPIKRTTTYFTELDMTFTWVNAEKPDETVTCQWYGQGVDIAGEKGVGKALTYAEKYFLLKQFNIATDQDDPDSFQRKLGDDSETRPKTQTKAPDKPKTQSFDSSKMATVLQNTAKGLGMTEEELLSFAEAEYRVQTLEQLTREQGLALLTTMKQYPKKEDN